MALECERWQWRELFASTHGPADPSTRLVLFVLALHMNQQGDNAFPAQELIARRSGLSVRSVRTHLGRAAKAGWLQVCQKQRRGQAWFVHEYAASIPDEMAVYRTEKPWEKDPQWRRGENSAGRADQPSTSEPIAQESKQSGNAPALRPANGAERAATNAKHPADSAATPGKFCHNARQGLPTNSSSNSSSKSPLNTPMEGAALTLSTAPLGNLQSGSNKSGDQEAKRKRVAKAMQNPELSKYGDADLAKVANVTIPELQEFRRSA